MHKIVLDHVNKLLEMRLSGPASLADIVSAGTAARAAVRSFGTPPGAHRSIYDLSEMGAISDEAIDKAFSEWADPRFTCVRARKVAIVAPPPLIRSRLEKLRDSRPGLSVFETRQQAMRWLFA